MQKYRIISFAAVHILIFIHIFWAKAYFLGSFDFQEFFDRFLGEGVLNPGAIMVIFAFIFTLIFGRFFCGWLCHFGAIQEFAWKVFSLLGIKPKTINSRLITFLPLFILLNFYIFPNLFLMINDSNEWSLSVDLTYPKVWTFLPGLIVGILTFVIDGFLIVYFLGRKGFCRFVCPWGAFLKAPTALSMFKVRKTGECTNCNLCTESCPIGIDVSYEINSYDKVISSNCTSCMMCIDGCPESALSYKFMNPITEIDNMQLKDFKFSPKSFINKKIKRYFVSLRHQDILSVPFVIVFGLLLDGLYHFGHMLSFGIAAIIGLTIFNQHFSKFLRKILFLFALFFMIFNGYIKYSQNSAINYYKDKEYAKALPYFQNIVDYYPIKIGKYHAYLSSCYMHINDIDKSYFHYNKAKLIIPKDQNVYELGLKLSNYKVSN